jgi:heme oxygenase (mycobilin-producing)
MQCCKTAITQLKGTGMAYLKHYIMIAKPGEETALAEALEALKVKVMPLDGCEEVIFLRDLDRPERFVFMERWTSVEAHKAGGAVLGKGALAPVLAALGEPPQAMSLAAA